jgi:hypothetical protein
MTARDAGPSAACTYTVQAFRDSSLWVIEVPEIDALTYTLKRNESGQIHCLCRSRSHTP